MPACNYREIASVVQHNASGKARAEIYAAELVFEVGVCVILVIRMRDRSSRKWVYQRGEESWR